MRVRMIPLRRTALAVALTLGGTNRLQAQSELISIEPSRRVSPGVGAVVGLVFTARGDSVFALGQNGRAAAIDVRGGGTGAELRVNGRPAAIVRSRDDNRVAIASGSEVTIIDGSQRRTARVGEEVTSLAISPSGNLLAAGTKGGMVVLLAAGTGDVSGRLRDGHRKKVVHVGFATDGETLLSIGEDKGIVYWDVKKMERLRQVTESEQTIVSAGGSQAGDLLFVGTESSFRNGQGMNPMTDMRYVNGIRAYDVTNAAPQKTYDLNGRAPIAVNVAPDCRHVATVARNLRGSSLVIFDVDRGSAAVDIPLDGRVQAAAFSSDGKSIAVGNEAGDVTLFAVRGVQPRPRCSADLRGIKYAITGPRTALVKPSKRMRFAVLDLDDNGVGPQISRAIADQMTTRLSLNPGIRLVERRRIAAILQEQNFQSSGRTDAQGAVQLARILNVQKVIMGAVAKLGTTMTIMVQMVDVETAAIDGAREVQCRSCELEDLTQAVSELAETVVGEADPALSNLPEPPEIQIDYPREGTEVTGNSVIVRGTIRYTRPIDGFELLANGRPQDASRLLDRGGAKMTKLLDGTGTIPFVQEIPLEGASTFIAVRAIGGDGNDEQRYVTVKRVAPPAAARGAAPANVPAANTTPGLSIDELVSAVKNKVPAARLVSLIGRFGIAFDPASGETRLRDASADPSVLSALRTARRASPPG
jgi:hypothetical protein